jgi:hypothetical protein
MKRLTRGEAIRAKCIDCCCGSYAEVRRCPCADCPLYRYRLGHEEDQEGIYTTEDSSEKKREYATVFSDED